MALYSVRVRGIYATALAVLYHERGFLLSDVSEIVRARLGVPVAEGRPPDVTVKSLDDRPDEVLVLGYPWEAGVEAESALLDAVRYAYAVRGRLGLYTVVDAVSLGGCRLRLPGGLEGRLDAGGSGCPGEGEPVRATVVREAVEPGSEPLLRREVRVVGRYVVVTAPGRGVSFSEHIRGEEERAPLLASLIGRVDTGVVHVHFRSAARHSPGEAGEEALQLAREAIALYREGPGGEPRVVRRGEYISIVGLPRPAKEALDALRARVTPTVGGHHTLKAGGREESLLVDYAEEALKLGACTPQAGAAAEWFLASRMRGRRVYIDHVRPDRSRLRLGPYTVESASRTPGGGIELRLRRTLTSPGVLDGLGVEKRPGDYAVTTLRTDSWLVRHEYYTREGKPLGVYVNVNTPPELSTQGIRYLDLYVDVVKRPGGDPEVIDVEELEKAHEEGLVTGDLYARAMEEAERAARALRGTAP